MADAPHPSLFSIPNHVAFADALAEGLLKQHRGDVLALAQGLIVVPNGRAARAIQDAFVRRAEPGLVLPRFAVIGDADLDEAIGAAFDPLEADIPPAIAPTERLMLLTRLVREQSDRPLDAGEAMRLAEQLGGAFDALSNEGKPLSALNDVQEVAELSERWKQAYAMFQNLAKSWPEVLAKRGEIDLSLRRNLLMEQAARRWRDTPSKGFIVAAGITIAVPAVAKLLRSISDLPNGSVVLPALDLVMPDEEWDALSPDSKDAPETHPQYAMKLLLDRMGIARGEVQPWPYKGGTDAPPRRSVLVSNAFAPAKFTSKWVELAKGDVNLKGVSAIEAANSAEEAMAVAIMMRETIEKPERRVALVTPDRGFAARVSALLGRWGIDADDSAGQPLSATPPASLMLALAQAAEERFAPLALLSLLKHPLVTGGMERLQWLDGVRALDILLRRPRPAPGLSGIDALLAEKDKRTAHWRAKAAKWWEAARPILEPLDAQNAAQHPGEALDNLRSVAEALAGDALWSGPAGRAFASAWEEARSTISLGLDEIESNAIVPVLQLIFDRQIVRPPQGGHPRVSILGLLESRLQHFDLVIASCLNEGSWPSLPAPDPWLAPRIRRELGLPGLEQRIGQSAHVLQGLLGAPEVVLTRAARDLSGPTIASRFWLRLDAMTGQVDRQKTALIYARAIDRPLPAERNKTKRPEPAPPVDIRPRSISVTDVDGLSADPYAFYAKKVLGLSKLDMVDADPSAAWRGTAVHDVLQAWWEEDACDPDALTKRAEALLEDQRAHPLMRALWTPRLMEAIEWIAARVRDNIDEGRIVRAAEIKGVIDLAGVTLDGRVDRIDRLADSSLAIIDYKTGQPPSPAKVAAGFAMQLGLLALIAERGGFKDVEGGVSAFEYWSLAKDSYRGGFGKFATPVDGSGNIKKTDRPFVATAQQHFTGAAEKWLTGTEPFKAKMNPDLASYPDYDQLMRLEEWYGQEGGEGSDDA